MRLLLVGAFPYPHHQGSQVYFQEQAIALRSAGADVTLLTYASGRNPPDRQSTNASTAEYWRALDGFPLRRSPSWTAPLTLRSGPSWARPLGDLGIVMSLRDAIASRSANDAFDAILTHNTEAALAALHGLGPGRPPILYCVHTLLHYELSAYLKGPKIGRFSNFPWQSRVQDTVSSRLDRGGAAIDRWIARRSDGWVALTHSSECVMRESSNAPGALIPPPVPDPRLASEAIQAAEVAAHHGLKVAGYFLYSGNLDAYQELDILAAVARDHSGDDPRNSGDEAMPLVIASHANQPTQRTDWARAAPGLEFRTVQSSAEMQSLLAGARASLVMRRRKGGFPIKLANSLAAGTPVIAFHDREWGLEHETNSLICSPEQPIPTLQRAIRRLAGDDKMAAQLALGARATYLKRHDPEQTAEATLALIKKVVSSRPT